MKIPRPFIPILCLALCLGQVGAASAAQARELHLALRQDAVVQGEYVSLADVLSVSEAGDAYAQRITGLIVSRTPKVGYADRFSRADLEQMIRTRLFPFTATVSWSGANSVSVHAAEQMLKGEELVASVREQVKQSLAARFPGCEIVSASAQADLALPVGQVSWTLRPIDMNHLASKLPVWTDVLVNGKSYRSVVLTFGVDLEAKVRVAKRDLNAGAEVTEKDFDVVVRDVADDMRTYFLDASLPGASRMRAPMKRGQILRQDQVAAQGSVFRGDELTLRLNAGGVTIETRAVAEQDGNVGDAVRLRPSSGSAPLSALIVAPGVAEVRGL